ncbi:hypothetical protein MNBD_GAMMA21-2184 [hydrothermal vent metagenome]|uniref:Uncharacterized protein n=1 Tax=hydrothermal vent metagenome TaxID=652676 RepID=A0A3B1AJB4_9ZZZZ
MTPGAKGEGAHNETRSVSMRNEAVLHETYNKIAGLGHGWPYVTKHKEVRE